jgi:hypothetical protein
MNMTWTELIDRLLTIQKANNYQPGWVVRMVQSAGHPPIQHWQRLMIEFGYSYQWPERMWNKKKQIDQPDCTAFYLICGSQLGDAKETSPSC